MVYDARRMTKVLFTANLRRHVSCAPCESSAATVRGALEDAFKANPGLREYVLDEQGALRKHMNVFVDGEMVSDRERLSDAAGKEVCVMQALSGG